MEDATILAGQLTALAKRGGGDDDDAKKHDDEEEETSPDPGDVSYADPRVGEHSSQEEQDIL